MAEEMENNTPVIITFEENDPKNPLNWSKARKWSTTLLASLSVFLMPLSSSIVAPELSIIKDELHMGSDIESALTMSTFVLTYCLGPLVLGPLSELFGRVTVFHSGNIFYLVFNLVCGFARNRGELLTFRLLSGIGGSAGLVVSQHIDFSRIISISFIPRLVQASSATVSKKKNAAWLSRYIILDLSPVLQWVQSSADTSPNIQHGAGHFGLHRYSPEP